EPAGRFLSLAHIQHGAGIARIGHDRQPAKTGYDLAQEFEFLATSIRDLVRQTGDIAARSGQTRNQAGAYWIVCRREDDRDDRCRLRCRESWRGCRRHNYIHLESDELGRVFCVALAAALCPAILDRQVATVDPSEFAEPLNKSGNPVALNRRVGTQEADGRQLARLLRGRRERPRNRAAEQRDEVAPFHWPMTSLAPTEKIPQLDYGRRLLHRGILADLMSQMGQSRPTRSKSHDRACPLRLSKRTICTPSQQVSALCRYCCKSPKLPGDNFP